MNSPRSLEACRMLGILPQSLYYIDFKTYIQLNPEIFRLSKELQQKRFENINKYRKETIEIVKKQRELIIEAQNESKKDDKNGKEKSENKEEDGEKKRNKKIEVLNLEKMLNDIRIREEKDIEKIKQKQKNQICSQIEQKIKNKIIIQKGDMRDQNVKLLHNEKREQLMKRAQEEDEKQRLTEINREFLYQQKLEKFEKENERKHEGEKLQIERNLNENKKKQKKKEEKEKLKSEEYEIRLEKSRKRIKENRQKIIESIEKKQEYTLKVFNKLMKDREKKLKEQKKINEEKNEKMKERLKIAKFKRDQINNKSVIRQERYAKVAEEEKKLKHKIIRERALSQCCLFEQNQERKDKMREELMEKYNKIEQEMKEKQEKREKEKKEEQRALCLHQEDEYLKQYKKEQNIERLGRINIYKIEKKNEEILNIFINNLGFVEKGIKQKKNQNESNGGEGASNDKDSQLNYLLYRNKIQINDSIKKSMNHFLGINLFHFFNSIILTNNEKNSDILSENMDEIGRASCRERV